MGYFVILLALWGVAACSPQPASSPNVLVILVDTLRPDRLGLYDSAHLTSPHLDALARESAVFDRAFAQAGWTKPSVPSLFTGKYPIQHGVFTGSTKNTAGRRTSSVLGRSHETMAEVFSAAGYETAAFVNNVQIRSFLGFDQGFGRYAEGLGDALDIGEAFASWERERDGDAPFFAYVHMLDPHWPYTAPKPFASLFPVPESDVDFNSVNWKALERAVESGTVTLSPNDLEAMRSCYDAEIRYTDVAIGQLLARLDADGELDNTVIVVTSDHGEEFYEHGGIGHGRHLHNELIHVPLLVRAPGLMPTRVSAPVQLIDVLPTLCDLLSLPEPEGVAGSSLRGWLEGKEMATRPVFADHRPGGTFGAVQQCVIDGRFKLIRHYERILSSGDGDGGLAVPTFEVGTWIAVEGESLEPGRAAAFEISKIEPEAEVNIRGQLAEYEPTSGKFEIMGVPCRLVEGGKIKNEEGARLQSTDVSDGTWVKVRGNGWEDGVFQVFRIKTLDDPARRKTQIEGPVLDIDDRVPPQYVRIPGLRIDFDDDTDFDGFPAAPREAEEAGSGTQARASAEALKERPMAACQLYDLSVDPGETRDIAAEDPERVGELLALLDAWVERHGVAEADEVALSEEALEQLRSLGYIK